MHVSVLAHWRARRCVCVCVRVCAQRRAWGHTRAQACALLVCAGVGVRVLVKPCRGTCASRASRKQTRPRIEEHNTTRH
eukprot:1275850-Alexandrium_andersonii.AAC.1